MKLTKKYLVTFNKELIGFGTKAKLFDPSFSTDSELYIYNIKTKENKLFNMNSRFNKIIWVDNFIIGGLENGTIVIIGERDDNKNSVNSINNDSIKDNSIKDNCINNDSIKDTNIINNDSIKDTNSIKDNSINNDSINNNNSINNNKINIKKLIKIYENDKLLIGDVRALTYNKEKKMLAAGSDKGRIVLWNIKKLEKPYSTGIKNSIGDIYSLSFNPTVSHILAVGTNHDVIILDLKQKKEVIRITENIDSPVKNIEWHPTKKTVLLIGTENLFFIFDLSDDQIQKIENGVLDFKIYEDKIYAFTKNKIMCINLNNKQKEYFSIENIFDFQVNLYLNLCSISYLSGITEILPITNFFKEIPKKLIKNQVIKIIKNNLISKKIKKIKIKKIKPNLLEKYSVNDLRKFSKSKINDETLNYLLNYKIGTEMKMNDKIEIPVSYFLKSESMKEIFEKLDFKSQVLISIFENNYEFFNSENLHVLLEIIYQQSLMHKQESSTTISENNATIFNCGIEDDIMHKLKSNTKISDCDMINNSINNNYIFNSEIENNPENIKKLKIFYYLTKNYEKYFKIRNKEIKKPESIFDFNEYLRNTLGLIEEMNGYLKNIDDLNNSEIKHFTDEYLELFKDFKFRFVNKSDNRIGMSNVCDNRMSDGNRMGMNNIGDNRMSDGNRIGMNNTGDNRMGMNNIGDNRMGMNNIGDNRMSDGNRMGSKYIFPQPIPKTQINADSQLKKTYAGTNLNENKYNSPKIIPQPVKNKDFENEKLKMTGKYPPFVTGKFNSSNYGDNLYREGNSSGKYPAPTNRYPSPPSFVDNSYTKKYPSPNEMYPSPSMKKKDIFIPQPNMSQSISQSSVSQPNISPNIPQLNISPNIPQPNINSSIPQPNINSSIPQPNISPNIPQPNISPNIPQPNIPQPNVPQSNISPNIKTITQSNIPQSNIHTDELLNEIKNKIDKIKNIALNKKNIIFKSRINESIQRLKHFENKKNFNYKFLTQLNSILEINFETREERQSQIEIVRKTVCNLNELYGKMDDIEIWLPGVMMLIQVALSD